MPYYTMPDQENLFVRRVGRGEPVLVLSGLGMQSWQWLPLSMQIVKNTSLLFPTGGALAVQKLCNSRARCHIKPLARCCSLN